MLFLFLFLYYFFIQWATEAGGKLEQPQHLEQEPLPAREARRCSGRCRTRPLLLPPSPPYPQLLLSLLINPNLGAEPHGLSVCPTKRI